MKWTELLGSKLCVYEVDRTVVRVWSGPNYWDVGFGGMKWTELLRTGFITDVCTGGDNRAL
jgi:hypothetical protein